MEAEDPASSEHKRRVSDLSPQETWSSCQNKPQGFLKTHDLAYPSHNGIVPLSQS